MSLIDELDMHWALYPHRWDCKCGSDGRCDYWAEEARKKREREEER